MVGRTAKRAVLGVLLILAIAAGATAWANRESWLAFLQGTEATAEHEEHDHPNADRVKVSAQAQARLQLDARPVRLATEPYWQTIAIPGSIVERPGGCDYGVVAPITGVVTEILAVPGEVVNPGRSLFKLRITSDELRASQSDLYTTTQDLAIANEQYLRLSALQGTVPQSQVLEVEYQQRRLRAKDKSLRFELATHGLTTEQVAAIALGQFVTEIDIHAPAPTHAAESGHGHAPVRFEVEELKVRAGDEVEKGATMCVLAEHQTLYVEGRVYVNEIPLVQRAAENGWHVQLDLPGNDAAIWSPVPRIAATMLSSLTTPSGQGTLAAAILLFPGVEALGDHELSIVSIGNRSDADSQTAPLFLRLPNEFREYEKDGRIYRNWRYRPAQRVHVLIPVKKFDDVFVLPAGAVVQDGVETFVFRQNGDSFDRKPVHVLYQDKQNAVIAHDGSINNGHYIAHNGAAHLLRALKMQSSAGEGGHHGHDH